jgi:hypothetical protein
MKLSKIYCPICGTELIDLNTTNIKLDQEKIVEHEYYCFDCELSIEIEECGEE